MRAVMNAMTELIRFFSHRWLVFGLMLIVAVGLVATACGGDDDDGEEVAPAAAAQPEPAPAPEPEPAPAPAPEPEPAPAASGPLKIGYLADFSGPLAEFGPVIQTGVELAIKHINDAGGVLGQPVEFVTGDTQVDPTIAVEEARRLVDIAGVHGIVGPLSSTATIAVAESVTGLAGIPTISPSATSPAVSNANDAGFLFRSVVSDGAQGPVLANLAVDEGFDNVAVLFLNDAYGQGLAEAFEASYGGTVTSTSYEPDQVTFLAELQRVAGEGAPVLVAIGFPTEAIIFVREALENDIFDQFLFVDGTKSQDLIDAIGGEFLDGFKGTAPTGGPETEATAAWNEAYIAEFGELPTRPFVRESYDAVIAIALAAELAGSTDGAAIRDALVQIASPPGTTVIPGADGIAAALTAVRNGEDINYEGAATTLDWNPEGDVTSGFIGIWQFAGGTIEELEEIPFSLE